MGHIYESAADSHAVSRRLTPGVTERARGAAPVLLPRAQSILYRTGARQASLGSKLHGGGGVACQASLYVGARFGTCFACPP
eukprot:1115377-Prymnesium_polylepis.1